jgi:peroxiredoxin Q/BCP
MIYKVNVGDKIPSFTAKDHLGHPFNHEDILGGPIVLYFYPKDETPGCTKQACSFRDQIDNMEKEDAVVIGVSSDNAESHRKFIETHHLNFTLFCDEHHDLATKFDVIHEKMVAGKKKLGIERTTFVIDGDGIIRWIERPVNIEGHTERVLEALKTINQ